MRHQIIQKKFVLTIYSFSCGVGGARVKHMHMNSHLHLHLNKHVQTHVTHTQTLTHAHTTHRVLNTHNTPHTTHTHTIHLTPHTPCSTSTHDATTTMSSHSTKRHHTTTIMSPRHIFFPSPPLLVSSPFLFALPLTLSVSRGICGSNTNKFHTCVSRCLHRFIAVFIFCNVPLTIRNMNTAIHELPFFAMANRDSTALIATILVGTLNTWKT